jgi:hypothetical protein
MRRRLLSSAVVTTALIGLGAALPAAPAGAASRGHPLVSPATGLPPGMQPTDAQQAKALSQAESGGAITPDAANNKLHYYGGPIVSNAEVVSVLWDSTGGTRTDQPGIDSFFNAILRSQYISWMHEYDTPADDPNTPAIEGSGQHTGYGRFRARAVLTPTNPDDHSLDNSTDIQAQLLAGINAGTIPAPTADSQGNPNTVYAMFFPSNDVITQGGNTSGVQFCAYHYATTMTYNGMHLPYLVLPDPTAAGISSGCGTSTATQNLQSFASHELIEAINDPQISQLIDNNASTLGYPAAWYGPASTDGEIADICNAQTGTVTGADSNSWLVQKEWSNSQGTCLVSRPRTTPGPPAGVTATPVAGGGVHVSWTEPVNDGFSPTLGYGIYRSQAPGDQGSQIQQMDWTQTSYDDHPPADGTYYYTVYDTNDGATGVTASQVAAISDGQPPGVTITGPTARFSLGTTVTTTYTGSDVASYDARYRLRSWNGSLGSYQQPADWTGTSQLSRSLTASAGKEYCFSVSATDGLGNVSGWSAEKCQTVALDDRSIPLGTHWTRGSSSTSYKGTFTRTTTAGATLKLAGARFTQVALVVTTCPTCGKVNVYSGSQLLGTVNLHSATTKRKVVKTLPAVSLRTATVMIKTLDAHQVIIDGVGASAT